MDGATVMAKLEAGEDEVFLKPTWEILRVGYRKSLGAKNGLMMRGSMGRNSYNDSLDPR